MIACGSAPSLAQVSTPPAPNQPSQSSITVPLPPLAPGPASPSRDLPSPVNVPLPAAPKLDGTPATPVASTNVGSNGRPDINPYDRDIDMTVPLTLGSKSLGDIGVRLTADDRFFVSTATFIDLMRPVLNDPARQEVSEALHDRPTFPPEALAGTGVELTYDPSSLSVVIVQVAPEKRAVEALFAPPRDDLNNIDLSPARLSGYVNLNVAETHLWEGPRGPRSDRPTVNFDGAIRVGPVVFEGDAQIGQQFTLTKGEDYGFSRNYARLVYDQPEDYRRWFLGDLDPETRGQQSFVRMAGVGVLRQRRRFNAFRSAILQNSRQLVIQRESTVRFLRNGVLYRQVLLQPGSYDFSSLPLLAGSNDVQVEVTDNTGKVQSLGYQQYLDPIDLEPGDFEYGAYLGPMSKTFGPSPIYDGPVAFTGFFRKAFVNRPALGVGLQLSREVQNATGQTQLVLGNGGRILFDLGASHSRSAGAGFAAGVAYDHSFDRGGLSDNLSVRADYISNRYSALGTPDGFNGTALAVTGQYARQFSLRLLGMLTGSYQRSQRSGRASYRLGAAGYYRLNDRFSVRAGADYFHSPSDLGLGNGVGFTLGLVFQPDYRRRAEARFESRQNIAEVSYDQAGLNELNSLGFGGVVGYQDGSVRAQGYGNYAANRFDAGISHSSFGPSLAGFGQVNATTVRVGTTIAFADGMLGLGRRINDSFILLAPHKNLGKRSVVAGESLVSNNYMGRSGPLGAALNNSLASYVTQSVQYDVEDPPTGYDIGPGVVRVRPAYRSGYAFHVGTSAFVSATGTLADGKGPLALRGGRVTLLDLREGDSPEPVPFFTNSVGRFAITNLLPGRHYLVETYGTNGQIDRSFDFTVPADTDGLVNLGTVRPATGR